MKTIPETFKKFGDEFKLLYQEQDWVIYERSNNQYELMKILPVKTDKILNNKVIMEAGIRLPSTTEWGTYGFTLISYDKALNKLKSLV